LNEGRSGQKKRLPGGFELFRIGDELAEGKLNIRDVVAFSDQMETGRHEPE
jgi:hypothetical protein